MLRTPRTVPGVVARPSGSYVECLTAIRWSGHGWRMVARGHGSSVMRSSRFQLKRARWDRRRKARIHRRWSLRRKVRRNRLDPGSSAATVPQPTAPDPPPAGSPGAPSVLPTPAAPEATNRDRSSSDRRHRSSIQDTSTRSLTRSRNSPASRPPSPSRLPRLVHVIGSQMLLPSASRTFTFRPRTLTLRTPITETGVPSRG